MAGPVYAAYRMTVACRPCPLDSVGWNRSPVDPPARVEIHAAPPPPAQIRAKVWLLFGKWLSLMPKSMQGNIFVYGLVGALAIALLVAAFTDIRRRQIDNWLNAAIALAAPAYWWAAGLSLWPDIAMQVGLAAATFLVLAGLFALRLMGGGDVKLLSALALWLAPGMFVKLLVIMSLLGGFLTIVFAAWHYTVTRKRDAKIPYGVAIACAGLITLAPVLEAGWRSVNGA